jgi:hypothetical protein
MPNPPNLAFFLGGHDLEMLTIRDLVAEVAADRLYDKGLAWGAKASAYRDEIAQAQAELLEPVLVELDDDIGVRGARIIVDHHGERAGRNAPTSLDQVFALLRLPAERWTRWLELVAANDRGHIREMRSIGASDEEIARVRAADRAAQGITALEERAGETAIENARRIAGGQLVVVKLPHCRTAVVADRLEMDRHPPENLLVFSPSEVNFFGRGTLVRALDERYPGGWTGGSLPERGFWGISPLPGDVVEFLTGAVTPAEEEFATRRR